MDLVLQVFCYSIVNGFLFTFIASVCTPLFLALNSRLGGRFWPTRFASFLIVMLIAFLLGSAFDLLWYFFANGRFYVMGDPVIHFSPLLPFGWWSLDRACGGHLQPGISMWQLRFAWAICAIITWVMAYKLKPRLWKHASNA